ncbi:hypothetical protein HDU76_013833, partial [Blyttiomyces sp. JEL0837]
GMAVDNAVYGSSLLFGFLVIVGGVALLFQYNMKEAVQEVKNRSRRGTLVGSGGGDGHQRLHNEDDGVGVGGKKGGGGTVRESIRKSNVMEERHSGGDSVSLQQASNNPTLWKSLTDKMTKSSQALNESENPFIESLTSSSNNVAATTASTTAAKPNIYIRAISHQDSFETIPSNLNNNNNIPIPLLPPPTASPSVILNLPAQFGISPLSGTPVRPGTPTYAGALPNYPAYSKISVGGNTRRREASADVESGDVGEGALGAVDEAESVGDGLDLGSEEPLNKNKDGDDGDALC